MNLKQRNKDRNLFQSIKRYWILIGASFAVLSLNGIDSAHSDNFKVEVTTPPLKMIGMGVGPIDVNTSKLRMIGVRVQPQEVNTPALRMTGIGEISEKKTIKFTPPQRERRKPEWTPIPPPRIEIDRDQEIKTKPLWPILKPIDRKPPERNLPERSPPERRPRFRIRD